MAKKWKDLDKKDKELLFIVAIFACIICGAAIAYAFTYEKDIFENKQIYASERGRLINAEIEMDKLIIYFNYTDTKFIIIDEFTVYDYAVCKSLIGSKVWVSYTIHITTKNGALFSSYGEFDHIGKIVGDLE